MILTLESLFNDASVINAMIDRVRATQMDQIYWQKYLTFEQTQSRMFKSYIGTATGVTAGSIIDRNANKPLRKRTSLGTGYGEVAILGDRYQLDNERLDMVKSLIDKYNQAKTTAQVDAMNQIINFISDDLRQVTLAPHKRMDLVVGSLRSTGKAEVKLADNPYGIELIDITLPFITYTPSADDKTNFITYLKNKIEEVRPKVGAITVMEMSRTTFNNYIAKSAEMASMYKMVLGYSEIAVNQNILTENMANQLFAGIGLPTIRVIEEYVDKADGTTQNAFADKRISCYTSDNLGKMMWHQPYESTDPVPNKTYVAREGGMFIASSRSEEGRFMEYMAEWIPNFSAPQKIVNFDLKNL